MSVRFNAIGPTLGQRLVDDLSNDSLLWGLFGITGSLGLFWSTRSMALFPMWSLIVIAISLSLIIFGAVLAHAWKRKTL